MDKVVIPALVAPVLAFCAAGIAILIATGSSAACGPAR